jgi:hypothetical protein
MCSIAYLCTLIKKFLKVTLINLLVEFVVQLEGQGRETDLTPDLIS